MTASITRQSALPLHELDKQAGIHVCSTRYREPFPPIHLLLVDGDYYAASPEALACLRSGWTPAELDLESVEGEDD